MSKNWVYSWLWKSSRTRQQCCRSESSAMKTGVPTNGSMVKNHISLKTEFGLFVTQRTSFLSWFQACQVRLLDRHRPQRRLRNRRVIHHHFLHLHFLHQQYVIFRFENGKMYLRWHFSSASVQFGWWSIRATWWNHDRTGKPVWFWGMVARIQGDFGGWWNSITRRLSRQFFSWSLFRADRNETWGIG